MRLPGLATLRPYLLATASMGAIHIAHGGIARLELTTRVGPHTRRVDEIDWPQRAPHRDPFATMRAA